MTKILVVDDDPQATTVISMLLTRRGYEVITENDSGSAVRVAIDTLPDLVILDLMMPDPDGFKVCRMLRADTRFIFTPILIITALDDTDSRIVAYGAGADDYLMKPYDVEEFTMTVKNLLQEEIEN